MTKGIPWMLIGSVVVLAFAFSHVHLSQIKLPQVNLPQFNPQPPAEQEPEAKSPEPQQNDKVVTVVGPLADYMEKQTSTLVASTRTHSHALHPSDHIAPSPVGTSDVILHKTFTIKSSQGFSFEIPAHATNPQLHGNYRSFANSIANAPTDDSADVAFFVLNDPQYQALILGHPSDALFSAEASHNQDVNFVLPASSNSPVKYHLLFRNVAGGAARKVVQADFAIDF